MVVYLFVMIIILTRNAKNDFLYNRYIIIFHTTTSIHYSSKLLSNHLFCVKDSMKKLLLDLAYFSLFFNQPQKRPRTLSTITPSYSEKNWSEFKVFPVAWLIRTVPNNNIMTPGNDQYLGHKEHLFGRVCTDIYRKMWATVDSCIIYYTSTWSG